MTALTAALLSALTASPPAAASSTAPDCSSSRSGPEHHGPAVEYRFDGISEAVLRVTVPVERVRHLVPSRYLLLGEAGGTATLVAAFGSVESLTVGCSRGRAAVVSEYGVFIESPDGSPGRHAYYLWQLSDDRVLVERMRALGAPAHLAASAFSTVTDGRQVQVAAQTLWSQSPNRLSATAPEPGTTRGADAPGVRFWFDGPHGTVLVSYECPSCLPRTPAIGEVSAASGTTLDHVLGGAARPGDGFFIRADLTAHARLVPTPTG